MAVLDDLPVAPVLPALAEALRTRRRAVLEAPPGAGKTTAVPLWLTGLARGAPGAVVGGRILMLEPRRAAARAAAGRMAALLGEAPGGRVGFRVRGDARSGPGARVEVVTEGVLTRMLQADPELPGVGCVIFDEFHERALDADLALALALDAAQALRPDLAILVMSATLDGAPVARLLGDAPVLRAPVPAHPVETIWEETPAALPLTEPDRLAARVAERTRDALAAHPGGVLVFLPGRAEIARVARLLGSEPAPGVRVEVLHGSLSLDRQMAVLTPPADARRVVLATALAESALTIPDIRVVVDAGLARRGRFDPGTGMERLVTERASRAEADQRRGRAGRLGPGFCYRLWARAEEGAMPPYPPPGIAAADLTGLALELAAWGVSDPAALAFLTPPPAPALAEGRAVLRALGALDAAGGITAHGRRLARVPAHPRLAHMLLSGGGAPRLAARLAALAGARDILGPGAPVDGALRLEALADPAAVAGERGVHVDARARSAVLAEAARLERLVPRTPRAAVEADPGLMMARAWPDRVALRRPGGGGRYLMASGKEAVMPPGDDLGAALIVAQDLDGDPRAARIRQAFVLDRGAFEAAFADAFEPVETCIWDARARRVVARRRVMFGAIALEDHPWPDPPEQAVTAALVEGVRALGIGALGWTASAERLRARIAWARASGVGGLPDMSDRGLTETLEAWLAPGLGGLRQAAELARLDPAPLLRAWVGRAGMQAVDAAAPAEFEAPTGTRVPIDYGGAVPSAAIRLQEVFGLTRHPVVAGVPLVLELLSPAGRPVQVTADLPGFWAGAYAEVRRDLRGRYPRHAWPEDPASAVPTRRAKPRRR